MKGKKKAERKSESGKLEIKAIKADEGIITARLATLNVKDHDGDVTLPGFFGTQEATIVPAHNWGHIWLGKAKVYESGDEALVDMKFNLDIPDGLHWFKALKFDFDEGNEPKAEYSYSYQIHEAEAGTHEGEKVRFLKKGEVVEVSPLLRGAGINTGTIDAKEEKPAEGKTLDEEFEDLEASLADAKSFIHRAKSLADLRINEGRRGQPFSKEKRERLGQLLETLSGLKGELGELLSETEPPDRDLGASLYAQYQKMQFDLQRHMR